MDLPDWAKRGRGVWAWNGTERPPFVETPGPGQESVWDFPRPPRIEPDARHIVIRVGDTVIADTTAALRVLETASPPTFYLPPSDVRMELLRHASGASRCEWKGTAQYWSLRPLLDLRVGIPAELEIETPLLTKSTPEGARVEEAAWSYPEPFEDFAALRDHLAFYPDRVDCALDREEVRAQAGGFYGGWITRDVVGPFKGDQGSGGW